jgi:peroxiredoxin
MHEKRPLEAGQPAPDFRLRGGDGTWYTRSEYLGDKNVLLVFFPFAFSPTCSLQLPELQRRMAELDAADIVVMGISVDSHWSSGAFARALGLRYPLLSDFQREASRAYGVLSPGGFSGRASFLVDKQGKVLWREVGPTLDDVPSLDAALAALAAQPRA